MTSTLWLADSTVIVAGSDEAAAHAKEEKEQSRAASTARKEALAVEAEQIGSESTQWKTAGDRLREILDEWKTIRGIDRKVDDALWKRYSKARESFNRRRGAHFAELDRDRASARSTKEELVERAREAVEPPLNGDRPPGNSAICSASGRLPAAHRARPTTTLWKRFKGAQDVFFAARNAAASERDAEFEQNAVAKEELLAANANIDPAHGLENARAALRDLQEKWDAIGKVPRDRMQELEAKLPGHRNQGARRGRRRVASHRSGSTCPGRAVQGAGEPVRGAGRQGSGCRQDKGRREGSRSGQAVA